MIINKVVEYLLKDSVFKLLDSIGKAHLNMFDKFTHRPLLTSETFHSETDNKGKSFGARIR